MGSIRQDFEPCYIRNGAIYAMKRDCIVKSKSRWGKKSFPLIMSDKKSINIDTKFDLLMAKMMIENGYCKNFPKINFILPKNEIDKSKKTILITTPTHILKNFKQKIEEKYNCLYIQPSDSTKLKISWSRLLDM